MIRQTSADIDVKLGEVVNALITAKEDELDYTLMKADYEFLVRTMDRTVKRLIHKFITGGKEHNPNHDELPFVQGVRHLDQIQDESIDQIFYGAGARETLNGK